jgi:hypothetical protein
VEGGAVKRRLGKTLLWVFLCFVAAVAVIYLWIWIAVWAGWDEG